MKINYEYIYIYFMNTYGLVLNYGHNNCVRRNMDKITIYEIKMVQLNMWKRSTLYKRLLVLSFYNWRGEDSYHNDLEHGHNTWDDVDGVHVYI